MTSSRLAAWFVKGNDLDGLRDEAVRQGVPMGEVKAGSRRRPDGIELTWRFTDPFKPVADGVVPFFIDWGKSPHPADGAAPGATLAGLEAEHPDPEFVRPILERLGLDLPLRQGRRPAVIATLDGPRGRVQLR